MDNFIEDIVIGSGPSGFSAILGLLSKGKRPLVVSSKNLSQDLTILRETWAKPAISENENKFENIFSYESDTFKIVRPNSDIHLTQSWGGLSNVWGTGIQPLDSSDMGDAPGDVRNEWQKAFSKILGFIPHTSGRDLTNNIFPWPEDVKTQPPPVSSNRIESILTKDFINIDNEKKIYIGQPRLSVDLSDSAKGCKFCGKCLVGCPYGSLLNTGIEIFNLIQNNRIDLKVGKVLEIRKHSLGLELQIEEEGHVISSLKCRNVYLAAGPLATPMILQRSGFIPSEFDVPDSQVFYTASLNFKRKIELKNFTLGQVIFTTDRNFDRNERFYMSLYENSDAIISRIYSLVPFGLAKILTKFNLNFIFDRIMLGIGFLPQSLSGKYRLIYNKIDKMHTIDLLHNSETKKTLTYNLKLIKKVLRSLNIYLLPTKKFYSGSVGGGYHSGASLPMGGEYIDWNGKFKNIDGLFICDASSLPEIIPGAHTLGAMANSYRIAAQND